MNMVNRGAVIQASAASNLSPTSLIPTELSIVVPTFNEKANIRPLVALLDAALQGISWEVVFVDDNSPDGTVAEVRALAQTDPRVRCLRRVGRRGLSSACVEGILSTSSPYVAVMDADLQHDETILPKMLNALRSGQYDVAVGSRYVDGGSTGSWSRDRVAMSDFATRLSRMALPANLKDPMSGFFMVERQAFEDTVENLSSVGFKILVDLFASAKKALRFTEIPFEFRERQFGESKLDTFVMWEYAMLLIDKKIGHILPSRFVGFLLVGGSGVAVNLAVLAVLFQLLAVEFVIAQSVAIVVSMTTNFLLNNFLTYRDRRLAGWSMLRGWMTFVAACSLGGIANVGVASWMYDGSFNWMLSALAGILVGTVWNYATTAVFTWGASKK